MELLPRRIRSQNLIGLPVTSLSCAVSVWLPTLVVTAIDNFPPRILARETFHCGVEVCPVISGCDTVRAGPCGASRQSKTNLAVQSNCVAVPAPPPAPVLEAAVGSSGPVTLTCTSGIWPVAEIEKSGPSVTNSSFSGMAANVYLACATDKRRAPRPGDPGEPAVASIDLQNARRDLPGQPGAGLDPAVGRHRPINPQHRGVRVWERVLAF